MIEWAGTPVGWLATTVEADALELLRIDLVPEHQRRGIGTTVVSRMLAQADADGRSVRTRVLRTNTVAAAWYRRLGFVEIGGDAVLVRLERPPGGAFGTS